MLCYSFTPIIICRFTLNLRQVKPSSSSWASGNQSASLRFVGNAGESLQFGGDDDEEGEGDTVEQSGLAERPGVPIEDKEEDVRMTMTGDHPAAQSVSPGHWREISIAPPIIVKGELLTAKTIAVLASRYPGVKPTSALTYA